MAISVKDIQEKEFSTQAKGGYNIEQVDDFLDEISDQMTVLVRENVDLARQVRSLEAELDTARKAAETARAKTPDYDEKALFENLQRSMRESLIGAQRIADETIEEAKQRAQKTVGDAQLEADTMTATAKQQADGMLSKAQTEAENITAEARQSLQSLQERYETLKASAATFKQDFARIIEQQNAALKQASDLF